MLGAAEVTADLREESRPVAAALCGTFALHHSLVSLTRDAVQHRAENALDGEVVPIVRPTWRLGDARRQILFNWYSHAL